MKGRAKNRIDDLAVCYSQTRSIEAREELAKSAQPLAKHMASRYARKFAPAHYDDMLSASNWGLAKFIEQYDHNRHTSFTSVVCSCMAMAIIDEVRSGLSSLPILTQRANRIAEQSVDDQYKRTGDRMEPILTDEQKRSTLRHRLILDSVGGGKIMPDTAYDILEQFEEALTLIPEPHRPILRAWYLEERTLQSIADEFGIAKGSVFNRIKETKHIFRAMLGEFAA